MRSCERLRRISLGRRTGEPTVRLWKRRPLSGGEALFPCRGSALHLLPVAAPPDPCQSATSTTRSWRTRSSRFTRHPMAPMGHRESIANSGIRGRRVGPKRVARIMTECGLVGVHPRRRWRRGKANTAPAPESAPKGTSPPRRQTTSGCLTSPSSPVGTANCCSPGSKTSTISRSWAGRWGSANHRPGPQRSRDGAQPPPPDNNELTHHPARGLQYTSLEFSTRLADWCINPSYSRSGTCFDNAAMESTWATSKTEIHHIYGSWSKMTRSQLRTALFSYIETFHNRNRHQTRPGHRTPADAYPASHAA